MATHTIEGHPELGIPPESTIRIESVAKAKPRRKNRKGELLQRKYKERRLFWTGIVDGPVTMNYDPGKYVWKLHCSSPGMVGGLMAYGEFMVGMTEDQFVKVSRMEPKNCKATMTTSGVRWSCTFPGCTKNNTSKISALMHETQVHYGVDILTEKNPEMIRHKDPLPPRRGPGRPPGAKNKTKEE